MTLELLYFDGCPNHESLLRGLGSLLEENGVEAEIELQRVESLEQAERDRFLGSPSVRVDGRDVEPGAEDRDDFGLKCRLYRTEDGLVGVPPDEWVLAALGAEPPKSREPSAPGQAEMALHAVGIAPELFAGSRAAGLADDDRDLYRLILERLSRGERPTRAWLARTADSEKVPERLERLARADLIGLDGEGELALAYPLSVHPSRQRVDTVDGRQLWACCAIDALGIPVMLGVDATIVARDLDDEAEIRVRVGPTGDPRPDPEDAVVLAAVAGPGDGTTACCACPFINFFPSSASAKAYQAAHPELSGIQLTMGEATAAGRLLFGGLFQHLG